MVPDRVTSRRVTRLLRDHAAARRPGTDPVLEAIATAVLVEEVFDITLTDDEIDPVLLDDPAAVTALVRRHGGTP